MPSLSDILSSNEAIISYVSIAAGSINALYDRFVREKKDINILPLTILSSFGGFMTGAETRGFLETVKGIGLSVAFYEAGYHGTYSLFNGTNKKNPDAKHL
jgi:hypothetical protein